MITTKDHYNGAAFTYGNEGVCSAYGDYRCADGRFQHIAIEGRYWDDDGEYPFSAHRDEYGNVSISGVPCNVIPAVATEVKAIICEIEVTVFPKDE